MINNRLLWVLCGLSSFFGSDVGIGTSIVPQAQDKSLHQIPVYSSYSYSSIESRSVDAAGG